MKRWLGGPSAFDGAIARLGQLAKVPGTVGFKISDEIGYGDGLTSTAQATDFLRQARSRLAEVAPGKKILVDAVVPELGCLPWRGANQESCAQRVRSKYPAATATAVESYLRRMIAAGHKVAIGWISARACWRTAPMPSGGPVGSRRRPMRGSVWRHRAGGL